MEIAIGVYIAFVSTLLALAFPFLQQIKSSFDQKYSSDRINDLFDKEWEGRWFLTFLKASVVALIIWSLKLEPVTPFKNIGFWIDNSAVLLVLLTAIPLISIFFLFVNKVFIYHSPKTLIIHLLEMHKRKEKRIGYFNGLVDVLLDAIKRQDANSYKTISMYLYDEFKVIRKSAVDKEAVLYPDDYYEAVYKIIEELVFLKDRNIPYLEYRATGHTWLLGDIESQPISDTTYAWLWRYLLLEVEHHKSDLIIHHWSKFHQLRDFGLIHIKPKYDDDHNLINKSEINEREKQIRKVDEFHYMLGGLLMYQRMFNAIGRIFDYTTSQPPRYVLLPVSMKQVFYWFNNFWDIYDMRYTFVSMHYHFPNIEGIKADGIVKRWVCTYIALLFLRQYRSDVRYYGIDPFAFPELPAPQSERRQWIEGLDAFERFVKEVLENDVLLKEVKLDFITKDWCRENDIKYPMEWIHEFKEWLIARYNHADATLALWEPKIQQFYESSASILDDWMAEMRRINNIKDIQKEYKSWDLIGSKMIQGKDAFRERPEVDHMDFDTFLAHITVDRIRNGLSSTFLFKTSDDFLLKPEDMFKGIDRIIKHEKDYVLVCFGIELRYYITHLKIHGLTEKEYKGVPIIQFNFTEVVNRSIFVLKSTDLPRIEAVDIERQTKDKFKLEKISDLYNFYGSVIEMDNVSDEFRNENGQKKSIEELNKSVLLNLHVQIQVRWKNDIKMVRLIPFSEYGQKGLPDELDDIG